MYWKLRRWMRDLKQTEDLKRHTIAMLKGIVIMTIMIFVVTGFFRLQDAIDQTHVLTEINQQLKDDLDATNHRINVLSVEYDDNMETLNIFYEMYERDLQKQQEWNDQRKYLTNENFNLGIEEVVMKYIRSESEDN